MLVSLLGGSSGHVNEASETNIWYQSNSCEAIGDNELTMCHKDLHIIVVHISWVTFALFSLHLNDVLVNQFMNGSIERTLVGVDIRKYIYVVRFSPIPSQKFWWERVQQLR